MSNTGTSSTRRTFLKVTGAVSVIGGTAWYTIFRDNEDTTTQTNQTQTEPGDEEINDEPEPNPDTGQNETETTTNTEPENERESENEPMNETEKQSTEEVVPDENETRPESTENESESDPTGGRERLDEDAVAIEDTALTPQEYGASRLAGTARNVSDTTIDLLILEIIYYEDGNRIGTGTDTINHLPPGAAKSFGHSVPPDGLRGVADSAEVTPRPYTDGD